jgi:predicted Mrr-cat superfamily restriction endonuclease
MEDLIDKDLLKAKYRDLFPNDPNMRINHNVGQIHRFVNELKFGDLVISLFIDSCLLVGIIESELYFKSDSTSPYPWRKKLNGLRRKLIDIPCLYLYKIR